MEHASRRAGPKRPQSGANVELAGAGPTKICVGTLSFLKRGDTGVRRAAYCVRKLFRMTVTRVSVQNVQVEP